MNQNYLIRERDTMRHKKQFWIPLGVVFVMAAVCTTAYADLTAQQIVTAFNNMNDNQGFIFNNQILGDTNIQRLSAQSETGNIDTNAYHFVIGNGNSFQTFSIQPGDTVASSGTATLSYNEAAGTTTTTDGTALSYGAAFLYAKYATGALVVTDDQAYEFSAALNTLTGHLPSSNWSTNSFLQELHNVEFNTNFWTRSYNPGLTYSGIGDYSVFVMRMTNWSDLTAQNVLYIARSSGPAAQPWVQLPPPPSSGVPEPAMLLLWTFGGLGLTGTSWFRNRNKVKLALA